MMASDGTEKKKNSDRAKLRPKNFLFSVTASGMASTVMATVVPTV